MQESLNRMSRHGSAHGTPRREPAGATLPAQHLLSRQLNVAGTAWQQLHDLERPCSAMNHPGSASVSGSATSSVKSGNPDGPAVNQGSSSTGGRVSAEGLEAPGWDSENGEMELQQEEAALWQAAVDCTVQITPLQTVKFSRKPSDSVSMAAERHAEGTKALLEQQLQGIEQNSEDSNAEQRNSMDTPPEQGGSCLVVRALNFQEDPASGTEAPDELCSNCCMLVAKMQKLHAQVGAESALLTTHTSCHLTSLATHCLR